MQLPEHILQPLLDSRDDSPPVIVFANYAYREIADNWIRAATRLNVENIWFVSLDQEIYDYFTSSNVQTILLEHEGNFQSLWILRIKLFRLLVDNNIDFIHSDADAVWLRNPIDRYYTDQKEIDLVISQGTVWPHDIFNAWQFVLCCGFFVLRANPRTSELLRELEADVESSGDDQISLNRVIFRRNMQWDINLPRLIPFNNAQLLVSPEMMTGRGRDLTVRVIPFIEVPRLHGNDINPYVEHPLSPKNNDEKKLLFQQYGLWLNDERP